MIDTKELRAVIKEIGLNGICVVEINSLLDRLEEAESDALEQARLNGMGSEREAALMAKLEAAEKARDDVAQQLVQSEQGKCKISEDCDALHARIEELEKEYQHVLEVKEIYQHQLNETEDERDALRAKVEAMERQEPVAKVRVHQTGGNAGIAWSVAPLNDFDALPLMRDGSKLYALPGAQAQPAPKAVAYLDLGVGGYMDIGTDLTDEELAALPKGRHMLGIIGTYGVDGYAPAQNVPSVPDDVTRDAERYRYLRARDDDTAGVGCWLEADGKVLARGWLYGDQLDSAIDTCIEMLAAAPEAKP